MNNEQLQNSQYKQLELQFSNWLSLLNFEATTIRYAPRKAREFFVWLESQQISSIEKVNKEITTAYFEYLKTRRNKRKNSRLSKNYLRSHITTLRNLSRYLAQTTGVSFEVDIKLPGTSSKDIVIFTPGQIKALYNACGDDIMGIRDRAMLAVYYGLGLRRNEGVNLNVSDINFDRNLVYVRKGKNYRERFVPMSWGVREDLYSYINYARSVLIKTPVMALFLNQYGNRLGSGTMADRLLKLKEKAAIDKETGLHGLRHSIATHLLQSGMALEKIKRFLGHSSLESTQIYTHIANEATG